jgi:uncharacterized protein YsxB (DUF464 family)
LISVDRTDNCITISGHAHYAEPGKDIVCAGISALVQNLIQSIEELTADKIQYTMLPGNCRIKYDAVSDAATLLINSFWLGVTAIAESYPENVIVAAK